MHELLYTRILFLFFFHIISFFLKWGYWFIFLLFIGIYWLRGTLPGSSIRIKVGSCLTLFLSSAVVTLYTEQVLQEVFLCVYIYLQLFFLVVNCESVAELIFGFSIIFYQTLLLSS